VIFRYGFGDPLLYSAELATLLFVWLIFLAVPLAAAEGAHMSADLITPLLPEWGKKWSDAVGLLLSSFLVGYIVLVSWDLTQRAVMELPTLGISVAWVYVAVPVGLSLYLGYLVLALLRLVLGRDGANRTHGTESAVAATSDLRPKA
jgi:TRAP-type C4-dicarboxylate transport system permease small subunit